MTAEDDVSENKSALYRRRDASFADARTVRKGNARYREHLASNNSLQIPTEDDEDDDAESLPTAAVCLPC